jgi:eIF4-gamma/eIF5/eIF2-epsilon
MRRLTCKWLQCMHFKFSATLFSSPKVLIKISCYIASTNHIFCSGMLLRWFHNLYDLEVIEEEAFMKWKEDISDDYAGKGNALFQVKDCTHNQIFPQIIKCNLISGQPVANMAG